MKKRKLMTLLFSVSMALFFLLNVQIFFFEQNSIGASVNSKSDFTKVLSLNKQQPMSNNVDAIKKRLNKLTTNVSEFINELADENMDYYELKIKFEKNSERLKALKDSISGNFFSNETEISWTDLFNKAENLEKEFNQKSKSVFINWFDEKIMILKKKNLDIPTSLLLLSKMDNMLYINKKLLSFSANKDLSDSEESPDNLMEKGKSQKQIENINYNKTKFEDLKDELKSLAKNIIEDITNEADKNISSIKSLKLDDLEENLEKLEPFYDKILWFSEIIFNLNDNFVKNETIGGNSKWKIISELPIAKKLQEQDRYYSKLIKNICNSIGKFKGWEYEINKISDNNSGMEEFIQKMDRYLESDEEKSCKSLEDFIKEINKKTGQATLLQLQKLEQLGKIIKLNHKYKHIILSRKNFTAPAYSLWIKLQRNIQRKIFKLGNIIRLNEEELAKVDKRKQSINDLLFVLECDYDE